MWSPLFGPKSKWNSSVETMAPHPLDVEDANGRITTNEERRAAMVRNKKEEEQATAECIARKEEEKRRPRPRRRLRQRSSSKASKPPAWIYLRGKRKAAYEMRVRTPLTGRVNEPTLGGLP